MILSRLTYLSCCCLLGRCGIAGPHLVTSPSHAEARGLTHGRHVVIHLVHRQALLDVRGEVAGRTPERTLTVVVLAVAVQVPLVRRPEIAHLALYHRHRVVFDVFGEARLHVRYVSALGAPEVLRLHVLLAAVLRQLLLAARGERAQRTFQNRRLVRLRRFVVFVGGDVTVLFGFGLFRGSLLCPARAFRLDALGAAVHHLGVAQQLLVMFRGVQAIGTFVDFHLLVVNIPQVVEVMPGVLREIVAGSARIVPLNLTLGQVLFVDTV